MSINHVCISGNLTRSPELRATQGGAEVLTMGVAVNDRRRNSQTGEWEDVPNFVDCVVFGKRADSLSKILRKGMKVTIEGKLRWSQWQDKSGQKRSKLSVVVDEIEFMSKREGTEGRGSTNSDSYSGSYQNTANSTSQGVSSDIYEDADIPFS